MDNIQDRVDNWRKKIEEKKDKNEKLSEKEAKIILDDEMILINQLLSEARKYIYGERKQVLLPHINETINTQPAKQNISMIN